MRHSEGRSQVSPDGEVPAPGRSSRVKAEAEMRRIRVLIVDDSSEFLRHAMAYLMQSPGVELTAWAYLGTEAIELVGRMKVDLVLMDMAMPGLNGLETARRIKALPDAPKVVLISLHDDVEYHVAALAAGADAFLSKRDLGAQLFPLLDQLFPDKARG